MQQALCICETPRLELNSLRTFLAIKRCEGTKIRKLLSNHEALFLSWRLCATRGIPVKVTRLLILVMGVHTPVPYRCVGTWVDRHFCQGKLLTNNLLITHWKHPSNLDIMPCFAHGEMLDRLERDRICYTYVDSQ